MAGIAIIGFFLALGYAAKSLTHIPLPPNVIGLVLLFAALKFGLVKLAWVEKASHLLLRHMMLFFIPSVVGAAFIASILSGQWIAVIVALAASTILSLAAAGWTAHRLLPREPDAALAGALADPGLHKSLEDVSETP